MRDLLASNRFGTPRLENPCGQIVLAAPSCSETELTSFEEGTYVQHVQARRRRPPQQELLSSYAAARYREYMAFQDSDRRSQIAIEV